MKIFKTRFPISKKFSANQSSLSWIITIPKGTKVKPCNDNTKQYFVDDLSFIDRKKEPLLYHDAYYYGIRVDNEFIEEMEE